MKARLAAVLGIIWLLTLFAAVAFYLTDLRRPDMQQLKNSLDSAVLKKPELALIDRLPSVFDRSVSLSALAIMSTGHEILGSMYEADRIDSGLYRRLLSDLKDRQLQKQPAYLVENGYNLVKYSLKDSDQYFILVTLSTLPFKQSWVQVRESHPSVFWVGAGVLSLSLILLLITWLNSGRSAPPGKNTVSSRAKYQHSKKVFNQRRQQGRKHSDREALIQQNDPLVTDHRGNLQFENQLLSLMARFREQCEYERVSFYLREIDGWIPVLQKRGQLIIRGNDLYPVPEIIQSFKKNTLWQKPLLSGDGHEAFIPVNREGRTRGAFKFRFRSDRQPDDEMLNRLQNTAAGFARSLDIQKTFESAVIDTTTGFYTYPYFYFSLKERLISGGSFAVTVIEFPEYKDSDEEKFKLWAHAVQNTLYHSGNSYPDTACRLTAGRFGFIFTLADSASPEPVFERSQAIRSSALKHTGRENYGAMLISPVDITGVDTFSRRIETALREALRHKSFGIAGSSVPAGIL